MTELIVNYKFLIYVFYIVLNLKVIYLYSILYILYYIILYNKSILIAGGILTA